MRMHFPFLGAVLLLLPVLSFAGNITCAECGMASDVVSKYTARIVQGDKTLYFCDIGDLLTYLNRKKEQNSEIQVRDFPTGQWIEGQKAYYVRDGKKFKSPMGWGVASFENSQKASAYGPVMDFETALRSVR